METCKYHSGKSECEKYVQTWDPFGDLDWICSQCRCMDKCDPVHISNRLWTYIGKYGFDEKVCQLYRDQETMTANEFLQQIEQKNTQIMTPEEFQKWVGDSKIDTNIEFLSKSDGRFNPKKAWENIQIGQEYWFFNFDSTLGPADWFKLKVTYKRSGIYFFKVADKRYKMERKEDYADVESQFTRTLHPVLFKNPVPEYFKEENFDTLKGRVKII